MSDLLPDIPRLYTALAEWIACMIYISVLKKRMHGWKLYVFSGGILVAQSIFLVFVKALPLTFWIPSMVVAIGMMLLLIYASCDLNVLEAGYYSVRAFVAAEFVASLEWQIHYFLFNEEHNKIWAETLLLVFTYGVFFFLIWLLEKHHVPDNGKLNIRHSELWSTVCIAISVFAISNLSFVTARTPFSGQYAKEIFNIRTLVDLGGFSILYAYHIQLYELRIKYELKAVQNILQNQYIQYQQSKESIDIINYKYHDLKNHIIALKAEKDASKRNAYLAQIEDEIRMYETQYKTGNHVLDTLLTSKNMSCLKKGITLTCVADGSLLNDMDVMDICTIFGNSLDNAIEYLQQIDEEKRLIHISLFTKKKFVMIRFENYFEGELSMEQGLPATTKKDQVNHGYGLKSIQYSVRKYNGVMNMTHKDKWFELNILIPELKKN